MNITVVGLGKIGLPLAVHFARQGHNVVGSDIDPGTVATINRGEVPFPGEAHLDGYLLEAIASGSFAATLDTAAAVAKSHAVVVVVPLFVDGDANPDFRALDMASRAIGRGLQPNTLVSYETTVPVGTTRKRLAPTLASESGLTSERDFHVVFSPERVRTGRVFEDLRKYPKLVGGLTEEGERLGCEFYASVLDFSPRDDLPRPNGVWSMGSAEAAEMAKLAETTYRDVNIGLANQFACYAETAGIDIYRVIEACNSQPFSHIHQPGIAVGGHCIPVYPRLYLWNDPDATVVKTAREANASMPEHVIKRVESILGPLSGKRVAVLGACYRGGVKETAFSGVWQVVDSLRRCQAVPLVHDPLYSDDELRAMGLIPFHRGEQADAVIVQADHADYASWGLGDVKGTLIVFDGRGVINPENWPGIRTVGVGRPG